MDKKFFIELLASDLKRWLSDLLDHYISKRDMYASGTDDFEYYNQEIQDIREILNEKGVVK